MAYAPSIIRRVGFDNGRHVKNDKKSYPYVRGLWLKFLGFLSVPLDVEADGVEGFRDFIMESAFKNQLESFLWAGEAVSLFDKGEQSPRDRDQIRDGCGSLRRVDMSRLKRRKCKKVLVLYGYAKAFI